MKIYIIHYDKLKERKPFIENQFKKEKIKEVDWFIQRQDKPYSDKEIKKYYKYNRHEWRKRTKLSNQNLISRKLSFGEISLSINHIKIWELCAKQKEMFLILEDDVILENDFLGKLNKVIEKLKNKEWGVCFLDWCDTKIPDVNKNGKNFFIEPNKDFCNWGTAAYLLKPEVAQKIIKEKYFIFPPDTELKYRCKKFGIKVIWVLPPLTKQASIYGTLKSSLSDGREKSGIKRFFSWRKKMYSFLIKIHLKGVVKRLYKLEDKIKRIV